MRQTEGAMSDGENAVKSELAAEVLRSFGTLRFAATGWSMLPSIWPGETLVVERVEPHQVRIGDVVLVGREGRLCAHRVVSTVEGSGTPQWFTQGDAMSVPDCPVAENELLGRVAYVIRSGKNVTLSTELSAPAKVIAKIVRRSFFAARVLVSLHSMVRTSEMPDPREAVLPCQG